MINETESSPSSSISHAVFQQMMGNIREGRWPLGKEIPSERTLIGEFGASRIAIREAMSMLRGLGVLDVGHGRRTRVCGMGAETLGRLIPLMMMADGPSIVGHVFEVRLALESMSARLAAGRRTEAQVSRLRELASLYRAQAEQGNDEALQTDLAFHAEVAQASGNPLFPMLLEALSAFVSYSQRESGRDIIRIQRATVAHETIAAAINAKDGGWAAAEMEAHLQFSRARRLQPESFP
jgi:DNA-binding FadR family transcriptional regulator